MGGRVMQARLVRTHLVHRRLRPLPPPLSLPVAVVLVHHFDRVVQALDTPISWPPQVIGRDPSVQSH